MVSRSSVPLIRVVIVIVILVVLAGVKFIIVVLSFVLIAQCFIGLLYFYKLGWVVHMFMTVRMVFLRQFVVFTFYFLLRRVVVHPKCVVEVVVPER